MANFIRSISFSVGNDRVRFTIQTDVEARDLRRERLNEIVNNTYSRNEFIILGEFCYTLMRDRNFAFYENHSHDNILYQFVYENRGEITLTREWMDIQSFDIYMNCIFLELDLGPSQ